MYSPLLLASGLLSLTVNFVLGTGVAVGQATPQITLRDIVPFERQMRLGNSYMSRAQWNTVLDYQPLVFFIEGAESQHEQEAKEVAALLGPWAAKLSTILEQDYISTLQLSRRPELPFTPIFVAANERIFLNVERTGVGTGRAADRGVTVFEDLSVVATYQQAITPDWSAAQARFPVLRALAREILRQHTPNGMRPRESWLLDGLASWHAAHTSDDPNELEHPQLNSSALKWLKMLALNETQWSAFQMPIGEFRSVRDDRQLLRMLRGRARAADVITPSPEQCREIYAHLSDVWVAFLLTAERRRYAAGVRNYLDITLRGEGSEQALVECVGCSFDELDDAYQRWTSQMVGRRPRPKSTKPTFSLKDYVTPDVAWIPQSTDGWLALALGIARRGDYEGAIDRLEAAFVELGPGPGRIRVERERERLIVLAETRDEVLNSLVGNPKRRLRIQLKDARFTSTVVGLADGVLRLGNNKAGVDQLDILAIPPAELARNLGSSSENKRADWARAYTRLLAGDPNWKRGIDPTTAGLSELTTETKVNWFELLKASEVCGRLDRLASLAQPTDIGTAEPILKFMRELLARYANDPAVNTRKEALARLSASAFSALYSDQDSSKLFHGSFEDREGGRIRVQYEFDDPAELKDWTADTGYLYKRRIKLGASIQSRMNADWSLKEGRLESLGGVCLRHVAAWRGPLTVRYELVFGEGSVGQPDSSQVVLGLCDNGQGNWVGAIDNHALATHKLTGQSASARAKTKPRAIEPGRVYQLELVHDGRAGVTLWVDGERVCNIASAKRIEGSIFLWVQCSTTVAVERIEIEGHLSDSVSEPARDSWVRAQLNELGLEHP
ncbi:MAG: hypothetical protein ACI835_004249 [Planctomycetota bacterium]|jgi:hypothetical protein